MTSQCLSILDTTFRDGEQAPGCSMTAQEKLQMAQALNALGVDAIEAGFATASEGDSSAIKAITREVRGPCIASMARSRREDVEAAARALEAIVDVDLLALVPAEKQPGFRAQVPV
jgi:2-isopropylmalate synthase